MAEEIANTFEKNPIEVKTKSASLIESISNVQKQLTKIEKDGHNQRQGYDYVTEAAIKANLQTKLAEEGIAIIPTYQILDSWNRNTNKGGILNFVSVLGTFEITNGTDSIYGSMPGIGMDSGDKAIYKAETGAQKNFLMQTFLMTTGDDPEQDWNTQPQQTNNYQQQNNVPQTDTFNPFDKFNSQRQQNHPILANDAKKKQIENQIQQLANLMKEDPTKIFDTLMSQFPGIQYGSLPDKEADNMMTYLNRQRTEIEATLKQMM